MADASVVAVALVPGVPHLRSQDAARWGNWAELASAARDVGERIRSLQPDTWVMMSTQWFTVLGHQFQGRPQLRGRHVDENWYDYDFGTFTYDLRVDRQLIDTWAMEAGVAGYQARVTDVDHFPVDTGTLAASELLDPARSRPVAQVSCNLYADAHDMFRIGEAGCRAARAIGRRVAVVAVSGLSTGFHDRWIAPAEEGFADAAEDAWNRRMLAALTNPDLENPLVLREEYAAAARVDSQFRALSFLAGYGGPLGRATVHAYGAVWGSGAAVITWNLGD